MSRDPAQQAGRPPGRPPRCAGGGRAEARPPRAGRPPERGPPRRRPARRGAARRTSGRGMRKGASWGSHLRYLRLGMQGDLDIVDPIIDEYLARIAGSPDPVEAEMRRYADERDGFPIVGPVVGGLLHQLALLLRARRIFEVGSGFGYSAFWFARALPETGAVTLTEYDPDHLELSHTWLGDAGLLDRCRIL